MRFLRVAGVMVALAAALVAGPARADDPTLTVTLTAGWDGAAVAGSWIPYRVDVKNTGTHEFSGTLVLNARRPAGSPNSAPSSVYGTTYETPFSIAGGVEKRVTIYGEFADATAGGPAGYEADLVDRSGAVVSSSGSASVSQRFGIGLLADSLQAQGEIKDVQLPSARPLSVVNLTPPDFPGSAIQLSGLSAVVIDNFDTSTLSQAQVQALQQYVGLGGSLVLGGGAGWRRTLTQLPPELVPLRPQASATVGLEPLLDLLGKHSPLVAQSVVGTLAPGARVVLADAAGNPLLAEVAYGAGRVVELAFDPADEPVASHAEEVRSSWAAALDRVVSAGSSGNAKFAPAVMVAPGAVSSAFPNQVGFNHYNLESQIAALLSDTAASALPPLGILGGLLILYVLVAGPLNYAVLRSLRRRELMWMTIPLVAILATGGAYSAGVLVHGQEYFVNELQVLRVAPSGGVEATTYDALFSPRRGDLTVQLPESSLASTFIPNYSGGGTTGDDRVLAGRNPSLKLAGVAVWQPRDFKYVEAAHVNVTVIAHLKLSKGQIVGSVTNNGRIPIRRLTLLTPDGRSATLAASLAPGATVTVGGILQTAPLQALNRVVIACGGPASTSVVPCGQTNGPQTPGDKQASLMLTAAGLLGSSGEVTSLTGIVDPIPSLRVGGTEPSRTALSAFATPIELEGIDTLSAGWASARVVAANNSSSFPMTVLDYDLPSSLAAGPLKLSVANASVMGAPFSVQKSQAEL
ncbi:MAG: hypothetical protein E6I85_02420, partial [Chloroflexi bacterium]